MTNSMANSILYAEINGVCILVLCLLGAKIRKSMFLQTQRWLLLRVVISNALFLLLDAIWIFVNNRVIGSSIPLNWLLNTGYFILSGVLSYQWFCYSEHVQESPLMQKRKYRNLVRLPMLLLVALTLSSCYTKWIFYIDAQNMYHRGPAYVLQLLFSYGYVIFTAVKAFWLSLHTDDFRRKIDLRTLASFVVPTLFAGATQVLLAGFPVLCVGNTIGLLYIYLTLQEQLISVDPLTKLNNRNQLMQYLSVRFAHPNKSKALVLLLMDVDHFKAINDKYGHVEGDRALKTVADCLTRACGGRRYFISRYGGDEFVVLFEQGPDEPVQPVCDAITAELENAEASYALSISIGCAVYAPEMKTQQEFIARADEALYRVKREKKQGAGHGFRPD